MADTAAVVDTVEEEIVDTEVATVDTEVAVDMVVVETVDTKAVVADGNIGMYFYLKKRYL